MGGEGFAIMGMRTELCNRAVLGRPGNSPLIISDHGEMDTSIEEVWGGVLPLAKDLSTLAF